MAINTGNVPSLLAPGLKKVYDLIINQHDNEWEKIFDTDVSKRAWEERQALIGFGDVPESSEGRAVTFDSISQGFKTVMTNKVFKLGFTVTREMKDDEQYNQAGKMTQALAQSVINTVENSGANVLNNGFDSNYAGVDGQPLFSTSHQYGNGETYSNKPSTDADLSMTSYKQMLIDLNKVTDARGKKIKLSPKLLVVTPDFEATAKEILLSEKDPESNNNAINTNKGKTPYMVNHYLTDPDAWFVRTSQEGLLCQKRVWPAEFSSDNDFKTQNELFQTYFRLVFGFYDPRSIYGSSGA